MKKNILISLVSIFIFCSLNLQVSSQTDAGDVAAGIFLGAIEDDLIKEGAQEISEIAQDLANAAKQSGQKKNVGPFLRSLKRNADALVRASQLLPPERCGKTFNNKNVDLQNLISKVEKFQERLCSEVNPTVPSRTFHPLAKHCKSPFDVKCVCGHHPDGPGCSSLGMSGGGMSGGETSEEMPESESQPPCLSDEDFAEQLEGVEEILQSFSEGIVKDSNGNGLPDACENNKQ